MPLSSMHIEDSWILNTLMANTADSIFVKDRQCRLLRVSKKMVLDLGYSDPEMIYGKTDIELFGEEFGKMTMIDDLSVMETGIPIIGKVEKYLGKKTKINWTSTTKIPLRNDNGEIVGLFGIAREINELKDSEIELQMRATHDQLTSLANRNLLVDHIEQAIFHSTSTKKFFVLLFIDLNGFKNINDQFGHDQGDRYLKSLAKVLLDNVHASDTVARIGGDEFVVLLEGISHIKDADILTQKFANLIQSQVDPEMHLVTASIGASIYPANGQDPETLLKAADQAMYAAKNAGVQYQIAPFSN